MWIETGIKSAGNRVVGNSAMRYFVKLSYKGTQYHGWQIQPNATTIQEVLQNAFSVILPENIHIIGAGRTDTGVHAKNFIAHFDIHKPIDDLEKLIFKLNSFLPKDIAIHKIYRVKEDAHARFSAISRTYEYHMHTRKDPFLNGYSYRLIQTLDIDLLNKASQSLFDYEDFTSFSKLHTDTKTNNCRIMRAEWIQNKNRLFFYIQADRFLRNMVRAICGTLLEVGSKKIGFNEFRTIIESKDRQKAGVSVPAEGLYLTEIKYPDDIEFDI